MFELMDRLPPAIERVAPQPITRAQRAGTQCPKKARASGPNDKGQLLPEG